MAGRLHKLMIEAAAKHLPPSAARLRLLDINGETGAALAELRGDLEVITAPGDVTQWPDFAESSIDAILALDYVLNPAFMDAALRVLRPGGRLIVVDAQGEVREEIGRRLESNGYTRILVETAVACPLPTGVLMRGEKPHTTGDTLARVQQVAEHDATSLVLDDYRGRYVHLLVIQTPNTPAWHRDDDAPITWEAMALPSANGDAPALLAFTSLPKAVAFMQQTVLEGTLSGVNKVAKFRKEVIAAWARPLHLNPDAVLLQASKPVRVLVDRDSAEAPDE